MHQPRILFLDAYDSFSNNIIVLLHEKLNAIVETIHIDDKRFATGKDSYFHEYLQRFDGVVAGPGPGDPRNAADLGLMSRLWTASDDLVVPVLGICLGFQSLALAFGASVEKLCEPRHGLITEVTHRGTSLFSQCGKIKATQYHSLHARLESTGVSMDPDRLWETQKDCPDLEPLAWDLSDARNGSVLMAIKHRSKPFYGVQYHPESICTNTAGASILQNWWAASLTWSIERASARIEDTRPYISASHAFDLDSSDCDSCSGEEFSLRSSIDGRDALHTGQTMPTAASTPALTRDSSRVREPAAMRSVSWRSVNADGAAPTLLAALQNVNENAILLESGTKNGKPVRAETGRFSIIACLDETPKAIRYFTTQHKIFSTLSGSSDSYVATMRDIWNHIEGFMTDNRATDGPAVTPFWGGLIGFITYEAGLETINVTPAEVNASHPDIWFVFVERSVVIDHVDKRIYIQTLHENDTAWMEETQSLIEATTASGIEEKMPASTPVITAPSQSGYSDKVRICQHHIRAGDSYELCLTDQSTVSFPADNRPSAWQLYGRLRSTNPAPFGAYLHLKGMSEGHEKRCDDVMILSSSPERFLSWSRSGTCQFRPIKGTVLKSEGMTKEKAVAMLKSDKEQAENLMIVDLIRHDLHGVVGSGNVKVEKLMQVEEYETVFQLVSVIEGRLPASDKSGIEVLSASLPPGSMTGAPKKRSCELLREVEDGARGIYSGVMGYFDVGGAGDFSVIIRTAFSWGDEDGTWCLGAGGAVTTLSTADGEFEEMMAKRASSLRAFEQAAVP